MEPLQVFLPAEEQPSVGVLQDVAEAGVLLGHVQRDNAGTQDPRSEVLHDGIGVVMGCRCNPVPPPDALRLQKGSGLEYPLGEIGVGVLRALVVLGVVNQEGLLGTLP